MKTFVTITLTSIFIISNFVAQAAGFSTLRMYTSEGNIMEVMIKKETITCEHTPGYEDHVSNYYAEKSRIIQMPDYKEKLVEETTLSTENFVYNLNAENKINDVLAYLRQEESLVESEIGELNTSEIFQTYQEEKIREQFSIQNLTQFTKSEKELEETLPVDFSSQEYMTK
ncbi:MAG: hypothetical protein ACLFQS_07575 [Bacteroidales bacterium]